MHLGRQIWEFSQLALSVHHVTEFPNHSTFCVYVTINSWTSGQVCPIANILEVAHASTCHLDFDDYMYTALIQNTIIYVYIVSQY
jgi:selenocysteine lyase/cysteine desulfurase